MMCVVVTESC